ncbi:MAG: GntR family transcriptional regulator [Deltaproteobacteria bacterium]|nr:GntR family transcriptional regulator [Deltaproteobacteria bacterium]
MRVLLSNASRDPIYTQISKQIRAQILSGDLPPGDPLPSIRKLAADLQISVITTKRAYEELERDGFIDTIVGKGSFVAEQNPELLRERHVRVVEQHLAQALAEARVAGLDLQQVLDLLHLMHSEDDS